MGTLTIKFNGALVKRYNKIRPSEAAMTCVDFKKSLEYPHPNNYPPGTYEFIIREDGKRVGGQKIVRMVERSND